MLSVLLLAALFGCAERKYGGDIEQITRISISENKVLSIDPSKEIEEKLFALLNSADWQKGLTDTAWDHTFTGDGIDLRYISRDGMFHDVKSGRRCVLSDADRAEFNALLDENIGNTDYQALLIRSGANTVTPLAFFNHQSRYGNDPFNASGAGFTADPEDIKKLPSITLSENIFAEIPEGMRIDSICIYGEAGKLGDISELADLPSGEHIVVISAVTDSRRGDESITDYYIQADQLVFKLMITEK